MSSYLKKLRRALSWMTVVSVIVWSLGPAMFLVPLPAAAAAAVTADSVGLINGNFPGAPIKASSAATAIVKLKIRPTVITTLGAVTASFSFADSNGTALAAALATTTLAAITTGDTSGVALYKDNTSGTVGAFDGADTVVPLATIAGSGWTAMTPTITLTAAATQPTLTADIDNIYFLVIKTSAAPANGTRIGVTIPTTSVATALDPTGVGPTAAFTANYLQVDTAVPTIVSASGYPDSNTISVRFSEPVQAVGGGNLTAAAFTYVTGGGGAATSTVSHTAGSDMATLTMTAALAAADFDGSPAKVAAGTNRISDMAGNVVAVTPQTSLTSPLAITTASIPSTYVGAVYNAGSTLVTFAASGGVASPTYTWLATSTSPTALATLGLSMASTGADKGKLIGTVANRTGSYGIAIDVGDGTSTTTKSFVVNIAATNVSGVPGISAVTPPGGAQSASNLSVTITGLNTSFSGTSAVVFSLPPGTAGTNGITAGTVVANSTTSITVPITIAAGASIGQRDVTVTTLTQVVTLPRGFEVAAAGSAGLNLMFPSSGATNIQLPPGFSFIPSITSGVQAYRVTVKSTSDFSGTALWDYTFPTPAIMSTSHCNGTICNVSYGTGLFRIIAQPGILAPGSTYYWNVRTYNVMPYQVSDSVAPLETTASRSFTITSSVTDGMPPMVQHRPVFRATASTDANLYARVMDNIANASTTPALVTKVFYCAGAGCSPSSQATGTSVGAGYYNYTIPATTVSTANTVIRYFLMATDGTNTSYASGASGSSTSTPPFQFTSVAADTASSIAGTVKDSLTNNLGNALVFAEGTAFVAATSAANGTFTFGSNNLLAGTYDLVAIKNGFADRMMSGIPTGTTGLNFSLPSGGGGGFGGDMTKPHIKFSGPPDGQSGIPGGSSDFKIFVVFDKTMNSDTVATSTTMMVKDVNPTSGVATNITNTKGSWTYYTTAPGAGGMLPNEANMAVWSLSGSSTFGDNKTIAVIVTPNVTDTAGNGVQGNQPDGSYVFSFTTGSMANFTGFNSTTGGFSGGGTFGSGAFMPPRVIGTTPPPGGFAVPTNTKVVINFSDAMADDSGTSYVLKNYVKLYTVSGTTETDISSTALSTVALDSAKLNATVTLSNSYNSGAFAASSNYRLKVWGGAKAASGMTLAQPGQESNSMFVADFKTSTGADTGTPTVVGVYPTNGATNVPVNVGAINAGFNKDMLSSTITSSTFYLSLGSTAVNGTVDYRPLERQAFFIPKTALTPNTTYTLNVLPGILGLNTQAVTATTTIFTTGAANSTKPKVNFASADDYNISITFSGPMNAAKATDTLNWDTSVLNPLAYDVIKSSATAGFATSTAGTTVSLASATFSYDAVNNTVNIKGVTLTVGQELYISFDSTGTNAPKDLSGNVIETAGLANTARATVQSSATTKGNLGPGAITGDAFSSGGGFMPTNFSSGTFGFAPPVEVRPFNTMAGQTTIYGVRLPLSKQIPNGGKVVLTFPSGFDVTAAQQDVNSPMRRDLNGPGTGTITFKCQTNSTAINGKACGGGVANSDETGAADGGLPDDGVVVDISARTVTVYISGATGSSNDFLTLDIAGIKNSTVPKDFNTSGYTVDVKIKNGATILESMTSAPIFIQSAGSYTLSGTITATGNDQTATMKVYLMSPMTGPLEATSVSFAGGETAAYSFTNLPAGEFMLFTDQTITLDGVQAGSKEFTGKTIPERIAITANKTYDFTLASNTAGGTDVTISIDGPSGEMVDIFAGSPTGFKVKQVTLDGSAGSEDFTFNLAAGTWSVGVGPQMPKGFSNSGPPPAPSYLPPKPKMILITAAGTCTLEGGTAGCAAAFTLTTSSKAIRGLVKDGANKVMANAQVYAYSPNGGLGTNAQSDTSGAFTLNVVDGSYVVGAFVPGMPPSKEVPVMVNSDPTKGGHANNYLFIDGVTTGIASTTAATAFVLKVAKPDYTISGKVTDGTNVVQGASIYSYRTDGPGGAHALTDSSGNYTIYVSSGSWKVGVFLPQYGQLTEQSVTVTTASQSNINFAPSGTGTFHTVSGNLKVGGVNRQGAFVRLSGNSTFNEAITDSSGNYSFKVPAGAGYVVRAFIPGIGETAPLAAFDVAEDVTGKNLTVAAANTITFNISPATTAISKAFIDLFSSTGVGGHTEINNATSTTMSLPAGSYKMNVNIPGIIVALTDVAGAGGSYSTTTGILTVDGAETITIALPALRTVSGTVVDAAAAVMADAWVDISNPTSGVHFGIKSGSDGTFSLKVADSSASYYINAMKPGYFREPTVLSVNGANATGQTLTIASASTSISGTIYIGSATAANAFVRAEKQGGGFSGTQADANGAFVLPVNSGTWNVYAVAEGYAEAKYASPVVVGATSVTGVNITVGASVSLDPPKSKSITPASGGTLEDTTAGVKLTFPANALGSSTSAGNVQAKETNNVRQTSSAKPIGGKAKEISATDSSGNAINTLNNSITVEMDYTKAELAATASSGDTSINTKAEADALAMAYWDEATANWVTMATTMTYKDADGAIITDATTIDTAAEFAANVATVTIAAATDHLSLYAPVVASNPSAPATPSGLAGTGSQALQITLTWTAVSGATGYDVYRSTTSTGTYSRLGSEPTTTGTTYVNTGLPAGTTYYYKVTSINASGESAASAAISAWTTGSVATGTSVAPAVSTSPASAAPAATPASETTAAKKAAPAAATGATVGAAPAASRQQTITISPTDAKYIGTLAELKKLASWQIWKDTVTGKLYKIEAKTAKAAQTIKAKLDKALKSATPATPAQAATISSAEAKYIKTPAELKALPSWQVWKDAVTGKLYKIEAKTAKAAQTIKAKLDKALKSAMPATPATPATSAATLKSNLSFGSKAADVKVLQEFLANQGAEIYPEGAVTGSFDAATLKAVKLFQEKYGLAKKGQAGYGNVGPVTRAKINQLLK